MEFAQDGDVSKFEAEDIADAMEYDGDPDVLMDALIYAGYIDQTETGRVIHDWYDYAGKLIERRKSDALRKANSRRKPAEDNKDSADSPKDVQRTTDGNGAESICNPNPNLNPNHKDIKDSCPEPPPANQDDSPSEDSGKKGKKKPEYAPDSQYYKMAVYFKSLIDEMSQAEGLTHLTDRTNLQTWADDFRKLVVLDKQSDTALIKSVMDWVVKDPFWKSNVLSAEKFRAQFAKLVIAKNNSGKKSSGQGYQRPQKPKVEIVPRDTEPQQKVSEEEYAELMKMAESMKAAKQKDNRHGQPVA
ncbi:hypothetical protein J41TS12_17710 [Paenibacillus antibioticophila]|uniref:Uncharacterized protein n=2 Tax=Paenibacillus antibioticophila TaxID=1274374 RepID=A0A920CES2_9BACL|nr:hypothetical protein J41TS12_17710 [Paenibacillus antibioticophila]